MKTMFLSIDNWMYIHISHGCVISFYFLFIRNMKNIKLLSPLSLLGLVILLAGCCEKVPETPVYDANSWQTMIEDSCKTYFDWCNTCTRIEWSTEAACTMAYCEEYSEPKCLDEEVTQEVIYDAESWKEIIPEDCQTFFDWCNNCTRIEWEDWAACTKMYCETYEEPKCTDWEVTYDAESWKEIVPEDCQTFFDWCNNCTRIEWEEWAACTKMYCETYEEPRCTDDTSENVNE